MSDPLIEAFWAYESALMADDLEALDRLFDPSPDTLRGDAAGLLVGHEAISRFRGGRGGAPKRTIVDVHVRPISDDHAVIVAITELAGGGRGQQTQVWRLTGDGWKVAVAHVAVPAPAFDPRIWRAVGDPLVAGIGSGPLVGQTVAVKDLYAVAGFAVGAGNPTWVESAPIEASHAWAVEQLLGAGADVRGIARTDEFAYSLAGDNVHYGTPPNPRAPHRISGGSSSGSASAVSLGQATIGLGTDTGGSIRIPAAYQGLFGLRTTHGAVPTSGLMPLAPSFDTVGWVTRDASLLRTVGESMLPDRSPRSADDLVLVPGLLDLASAEVAVAISAFADRLSSVFREDWDLRDLPTWKQAFVTVQAAEAWQSHGWWLGHRLDSLGPGVRSRFESASRVTAAEAADAREVVSVARSAIRAFVGDRILVLPSAPTVAPAMGADLAPIRDANLLLTCLAGIGGLPALSMPLTTHEGLPCGVCLVAAPGRDLDLLELAEQVAT